MRTGFSTGTAAAAAVKTGLKAALGSDVGRSTQVTLPGGKTISIPVEYVRDRGTSWECGVVKDGGDDPDVTHGALIGARVRPAPGKGLIIKAGEGVGKVTKPGLPVGIGEPAVNPVPRKMIGWAVDEAFSEAEAGLPGAEIELFIPGGEELARQTLNPRLGIVGGLSILGTTGIVRPFSHGAYRATIFAALKVARACGHRELVITTGTSSDAAARLMFPSIPEEGFVQMADYVGFTMQRLKVMGFVRATVVCFFGKMVKMAQRMVHTHASAGPVDMGQVSRWIEEVTGDSALSRAAARANTAREILDLLRSHHRNAVFHMAGKALRFLQDLAGERVEVGLVLLDYDSTVLLKRGVAWDP